MITAVDTSVLLDVLGGDARFGERSRTALKSCRAQGVLVACEAVWAELSSFFDDADAASHALGEAGIEFDPLSRDAALTAGFAWRAYRQSGGQRGRVAADFLTGAHALVQAERLVTRDRGFYRGCFSALEILDPSDPR